MDCHNKAGRCANTKANTSACTQGTTTDHGTRCMPVFAFACKTEVTKTAMQNVHIVFAKSVHKDVGEKLRSGKAKPYVIASMPTRNTVALFQ